MGTEYLLYKNDSFGKLLIDEMSNKFAIEFVPSDSSYVHLSEQMPPEEMAKIMLEGLTICSYWMNTDDLKVLIKEHVNRKIY